MNKFLTTLLLITVSSFGFSATWVTNKDHSEILFQVPYMGVSEVTGRFNDFTGQAELKDNGSGIESLIVQIESASIDTGNKMRDNHLKANDFFQSKEHQYITFKSDKVSQISTNEYRASGTLTIKGITKPMTINFATTDSLKDTWGYDNKFVKFKSAVNRKDYNITWNKTLDGQKFLLGEDITFWGTFQIQPSKNKTPNSKHMIPDTEYIRERDKERIKSESSFSRKLRNLINGK